MALVIPPGYAFVAMHFNVPGQSGHVISTFGIRGGIAPDWQDIVTTVVASFGNNPLNSLSIDCELDYAHWTANVLGVMTEGDVQAQTFGNLSGPCMAPNNAWLVQKKSGFPGRTNRGRMYLPGLMEEDVESNGTIDGGTLGAMNTALQLWLDDVADAEVDLVIFHDDEGAGAADDPTVITSLIAQGKIATQRQRLRD